jgi:hypothetical protein
MEKITQKIAALPPDAPFFSLEFFPPKTHTVGSAHPHPAKLPLQRSTEVVSRRASPTCTPASSASPRRCARSSSR